eukprot:7828340-Pyramimonas_sp.AAC.1
MPGNLATSPGPEGAPVYHPSGTTAPPNPQPWPPPPPGGQQWSPPQGHTLGRGSVSVLPAFWSNGGEPLPLSLNCRLPTA